MPAHKARGHVATRAIRVLVYVKVANISPQMTQKSACTVVIIVRALIRQQKDGGLKRKSMTTQLLLSPATNVSAFLAQEDNQLKRY
ncbi:MAG: hypothetical protein COB66_02735 [Coxiella sp. (in: Bacteria)]|nr:MAG: hypothetical protein COB66_02735 [Coxiella sp. (in: g-proteobacteria)]